MFYNNPSVQFYSVRDINLFSIFFGRYNETRRFLIKKQIQLEKLVQVINSRGNLSYFESEKNASVDKWCRIYLVKEFKEYLPDKEEFSLILDYFNLNKNTTLEEYVGIIKDDFKRTILLNNRKLHV